MKKSAIILIVLSLTAARPALAERNPADPYERYNRVMFKVNDTADKYVLSPVARGYRAVTPKPVRTGVTNFFDNLRDVVSMGSNLLRLDIKRSSEDFVRVGINSTFGLGGLINIADAGGVPNNKNTLGDTFASWGWKNSNYFVYPLTGPSTVRDSIGSTITTFYPIDNVVFPKPAGRIALQSLRAANIREQYLDLTDSLNDAAIDKYAYTRDLFMKMRARQTGSALPQGADEEIDIDDLVSDENSPPPAREYTPATEQAAEAQPQASSPDMPEARGGILTLWHPDS
ncbi:MULTISPECIES: VacJ family lipoprotein [Neisseria]|uniref:MlaA family lipoprotein n=1 Tax=Neisseria TaxID=482 RepID=UPI00164B59F6|nr:MULTISPECIES: VacJ family lipoprotein [Neisseria]MBF0803780.1 VacJ family lipoprotein [Neisseria sp. 19428wB4_WF04]QNT59820.1 vacJ like lipofamily protein [Neisseria musculi]